MRITLLRPLGNGERLLSCDCVFDSLSLPQIALAMGMPFAVEADACLYCFTFRINYPVDATVEQHACIRAQIGMHASEWTAYKTAVHRAPNWPRYCNRTSDDKEAIGLLADR